jgi:uncharacterized protein (DUF433 family)
MKIQAITKTTAGRIELGNYIVVDPRICRGKPTFRGTRIMVWQVLEDVAEGKSRDFISQVRWGGRVSPAAIAEAVRLAQRALLDSEGHLVRKPVRTRPIEPVAA